MTERIYSLPPILPPDSRTLVLGTIASVASLEKQQYYGHRQNAFWRILMQLAGIPFSEDYEERKRALYRLKIALWDVVDSCVRPGSLDVKIRQERIHDFSVVWRQCPDIDRVFCNGKTAERLFLKNVVLPQGVRFMGALPSTSPAYTLSYEEKLDAWRAVL
jgi:hypoxanthine-DNA glycosylase